MKQFIPISHFCVVFLFTTQIWGQTWNLSHTMTATLDNAGIMTISTSANSEAMPDFSLYGTPWNDLYDNIFSVVINNKVTTIGNCAFKSC